MSDYGAVRVIEAGTFCEVAVTVASNIYIEQRGDHVVMDHRQAKELATFLLEHVVEEA